MPEEIDRIPSNGLRPSLLEQFVAANPHLEWLITAVKDPKNIEQLVIHGKGNLGYPLVRFLTINYSASTDVTFGPIPKKIIQFWHDRNRIPIDVQTCMDSWNSVETDGYTRLLFDDETAHAFIADRFTSVEADAYKLCHHPAMRCDYFRLAYLLQEGGIYIDADETYLGTNFSGIMSEAELLIQPLSARIGGKSGLPPTPESLDENAAEVGWFSYCNNNPLMSVAQHPVLRIALDRATQLIKSAHENGYRPQINTTTGPENMIRALLEFVLRELDIDRPFASLRMLSNWTEIAKSPWSLSYRSDDRNWRNNADFYASAQKTVVTVSHPLNESFKRVYDSKGWGRGSGPGSHPYYTIEYRAFLQKFLRINNIRSIVDIGCGDWQFMKFVDLEGIDYFGLDVVEEIIKENQKNYAREGLTFSVMPIDPSDLPKADLLIVKDVLQHLPDDLIFDFAENVQSRYPISLITNSYEKLSIPHNVPIAPGGFRTLDLTAAPYHFEGTYLFEFWAQPWERIRTLLCKGCPIKTAT